MPFLHSVALALPPAHGVMANTQTPTLGLGEHSPAQPWGGLSGDRDAAGREGAATVLVLPGFPGGPAVLGVRCLFRLPVKPSQPRANLHGTAGAGETGASYSLG